LSQPGVNFAQHRNDRTYALAGVVGGNESISQFRLSPDRAAQMVGVKEIAH
jgi:hypothetical protein